jgi:hypothetical protein
MSRVIHWLAFAVVIVLGAMSLVRDINMLIHHLPFNGGIPLLIPVVMTIGAIALWKTKL